MNHTPTPWTLEQGDKHCKLFSAHGPTGWTFIGEIQTGHACDTDYRKNAEFIVKACNAHEELVKIAQAYRNHLKVSAHTDGEVATYQHINNLLTTIEKGV